MNQPIIWLNEDPTLFPSHNSAFKEPNGLLAAGGDLSPSRLLNAYSLGIFPWYNEDDPILWWSPDPRSVVIPQQFEPSRTLKKVINRSEFTTTTDTCFTEVMESCAALRKDGLGTWINSDMIESYTKLHKMGFAHSVECWQDSKLVGGLYGIAIGKAFFGESMFSKVSNASKVAFASLCNHLVKAGFEIIDCQVHNPHLQSLGASEIPRASFLEILKHATAAETIKEWTFE
ncbi:leucyl/phenylalanyl-tRNA--protein transferase [Oceaniserpentilla sp. 4NH20-0058]|uniref:leucyl/phenylalanyl-tRNA--protein transferase n=1 Tax=Oceaniserpentilla sp. 4NH20-0058 TaxID=3127660 RepID=UPI00310BCEF7